MLLGCLPLSAAAESASASAHSAGLRLSRSCACQVSATRNAPPTYHAASKPSLADKAGPGNHGILPLPQQLNLNPHKVALGKRLFEDKQLSGNRSMACRNCHYLEQGGADGKPLSMAIDGQPRSRNTPSIFNAGLLLLLNWEGQRRDLADVTEAIIKSKQGLASDWPRIVARLNADPGYRDSFQKLYADSIQPNNVKDALVEYMRSLITPNSRFDRYLRGERRALTQTEQEGYRLFKSYGCGSCHQGVAIGGNMVAPLGLFINDLAHAGTTLDEDPGKYAGTKNVRDKHVFRVPSLRNIALTGPYMHTGTINTLDDAVDLMGRLMLGRDIPEEHRRLLVAFLKTLTGEYQGKPL